MKCDTVADLHEERQPVEGEAAYRRKRSSAFKAAVKDGEAEVPDRPRLVPHQPRRPGRRTVPQVDRRVRR